MPSTPPVCTQYIPVRTQLHSQYKFTPSTTPVQPQYNPNTTPIHAQYTPSSPPVHAQYTPVHPRTRPAHPQASAPAVDLACFPRRPRGRAGLCHRLRVFAGRSPCADLGPLCELRAPPGAPVLPADLRDSLLGTDLCFLLVSSNQCDPGRDFCLLGPGFSTQAVWKGTWAQRQARPQALRPLTDSRSASREGRGLSCLLLGAALPTTFIHDRGTLTGKDKTGSRARAEGGRLQFRRVSGGPGPLAGVPGSPVPTARRGLPPRGDPRLRRAPLSWVGVGGESGPCGPDPGPRGPRTLRRSGRENWGSQGSPGLRGNVPARPQPTRRPRLRVPPRVCRLLPTAAPSREEGSSCLGAGAGRAGERRSANTGVRAQGTRAAARVPPRAPLGNVYFPGEEKVWPSLSADRSATSKLRASAGAGREAFPNTRGKAVFIEKPVRTAAGSRRRGGPSAGSPELRPRGLRPRDPGL